MALLIECLHCRARQSERSKTWPLCKGCGLDLSKSKDKIYWLEYYVNGKRKRERVGPWKKLAVEVLAKRKAQVAENKFLDKVKIPNKVQFNHFAKKYLEWCRTNNKHPRTKEHRVKLLSAHFGKKLIADISSFDVEKYKQERKKEVSPQTVNKELTVLRHLLNKAREWGMLHKENPCSSVKWFKKAPGRLRFLDKEEIMRLFNSCNGYLKDMVLIALHSGLRKGEILNLGHEDINLNLRLIYVRNSKIGESRNIPINSTLLDVLGRLKREARGEYLFENPKTSKPFDDVKKSFKSALKRAEIKGATFHTLRHTFASHLIMQGTDLPTVASLLGHRDISMTMRYAHLSPNHRKLAVERLTNLISLTAQVSCMKGEKKIIELPVKQN